MRRRLTSFIALALLGCGGATTTLQTPAAVPTTHAASSVEVPFVATGAPAPLPVGVTSFGAAAADGSIYMLGGYHGIPHHYVPEGQSSRLSRLDPNLGAQWETVAELPSGIQSVSLSELGGALHRVGGMRIRDTNDMHSLDEHARFRDGEWESLAPLPAPRSSHDAIGHGDSVYVVGGWRLTGDAGSGEFYDDLLVWNEASGWESRPSPVERRALAVAATQTHLLAIGGIDSSGEISDRVDMYDLESQTWTLGPALPGENNGFGASAVGVEDRIYVSGGNGELWRLRVGDSAWERAGSLAFPRFFHRLVSPAPERIVALGGIGGMHTYGRTRIVETIATESGPTESLSLWTTPAPGPARNRQGIILRDDHLLLFGGNNSLGQHDFEPENFLNDAHVLHIPSLRIGDVPDYPAQRQTMQTLNLEQAGISVGGFGHDGNVARTHTQAYEYDFAAGAWSERPGLPVPRSQFGLVHQGEQIWVFGGLDYDPTRPREDQFRHLVEVLRAPADGSEAFSETSVTLPGPRRAFGGALFEDRYYIIGGMREGFQFVDTCTAFEFASEQWSSISCPSMVRLNPQLVTVGERLVLVGGTVMVDGELSQAQHLEIYDPSTDSWTTMETELPFAARHMRAFAYRGKLLIYSVHNEEGNLNLGLITLPPPTD